MAAVTARGLWDRMRLDGRTVLITGGAGRLGAVMVGTCLELGARVVVLDRDGEAAGRLAERFRLRGMPGFRFLEGDLTDTGFLEGVPADLRAAEGGLDVLVHAAALVGTSALEGWAVPFERQSVATWRRALEVNLTAVFALTRACAPLLRRSGHGSVVTIGSIYGVAAPDWRLYEGTSLGNPAAYAASKGGLLQLTRWLATALAPRVRVNMISMGGVRHGHRDPFLWRYEERTPLRRMASPQDVAGALAYLAGDLSAYVTGHNLMVDGGWTLW